MPDPLSLLRFVALVVFIGLVAVGLWLLDVAWWVVPPVMAGALLIAWTIEWVAWRGSVTSSVVRETAVPVAAAAAPPAPEPAAAPPAPEPTSFEPVSSPPPVQAEAPSAPPSPPPSMPDPEPATQTEPPMEPEPPPPPPPSPEPEREPEPEPEPAPPSTPEPPASPPEPVAAAPPAQEETPRERRRPRRLRLRSVPPPLPQPELEPVTEPPPQMPSVVEFRPRTVEPRQWNIWDLERIAHEEAAEHPDRRDEWSYLFLHLRQFATADGSLPTEFDGLVRESFAGLLERSNGV